MHHACGALHNVVFTIGDRGDDGTVTDAIYASTVGGTAPWRRVHMCLDDTAGRVSVRLSCSWSQACVLLVVDQEKQPCARTIPPTVRLRASRAAGAGVLFIVWFAWLPWNHDLRGLRTLAEGQDDSSV